MENNKEIEKFLNENILQKVEDMNTFFPHCLTFSDSEEDEELCNKITFVNFDDKDQYNSRQCVRDLITNYIRNKKSLEENIQDLKSGLVKSPFVFSLNYKNLNYLKREK